MEFTYEDYLAQLTGDHVQTTNVSTTAAKIQQVTVIKKGLKYIEDQLASGYLCGYEWSVKMPVGDDLSVRLETNLINIPMKEAERLNPKLLDRNQPYPVNVYMVAEGDQLNKSGLRIDELVSGDDLDDSAELVTKFQEWVASQLAMVTENRQTADEA
ncbi:hypothetical protein [uncultured Limosilactobacillus sp.]|uniref:hypothetical protein n=1 Tax=uncultured Limosilactobacillus sp. TaxID=2837629 RepID=UPI0025F51287|nr:hypothetical protein [uncultured Limosilactobacillus sp.]